MQININTADQPTTEWAPLAPGRYTVAITGMEDRQTKSGTGQFTQVEFTVMDGPAQNRKLWHIFNFINQSVRAVEIANDQFRRLCLAVGLQGTVQHTEAVLNRRLAVEVITKPGETRNTISNFIALNGTVPAASGAGNAGAQAPQPQAPAPQPAAPTPDDEIPF